MPIAWRFHFAPLVNFAIIGILLWQTNSWSGNIWVFTSRLHFVYLSCRNIKVKTPPKLCVSVSQHKGRKKEVPNCAGQWICDCDHKINLSSPSEQEIWVHSLQRVFVGRKYTMHSLIFEYVLNTFWLCPIVTSTQTSCGLHIWSTCAFCALQ